ncbi:MAG: stage II sporulation protein M [Verrucomicrobiales bacterium]
MNRRQFENRNAKHWQDYEDLVKSLEAKQTPEDIHKLPGLFRQICSDLALAESRSYGLKISERLNDLVIRGYRFIYRGVGSGLHSALNFFISTFPNALRRDARLFWLCMALFWLPYGGFMLASKFAPEWIEIFLGEGAMMQMEMMYGKDASIDSIREEFDSNFAMFGFYVFNNISISFRMFAGGILFCVGTIFSLVFNGMHIGASAAYVHYALDTEKFYSFVATHSSWELIGIIISGVAGMRIGLALLHPGRLTRRAALAHAGKRAVTMLYGAATMIFIAAILEAFVSATRLQPGTKYLLGISFWIILTLYFLLCGRGRSHELKLADRV